MTTCTDGSVRFGKPDCTNPEICIPPFKPICTFDAPRATEPMTLEAPHPRIVLPLPPSDCACFSFEKKNGTVTIKKKADTTPPKFTVEITQAGDDCCEGKYKVTPSIEIPECILDDDVRTGTCELGGLGGVLTWTLRRTNCELSLEMSGNISAPPGPCLPTFNLKTEELKIKYKDDESATKEQETTGSFTVKADFKEGCPLYIPEEINLGVLPSGFSSGGDVFKGRGGSGGNGFPAGKAYLTGKLAGDTTWHCGGYGDRRVDDVTANYRRGNKMRGGVDVTAEYGAIPIPVVQLKATQQLVDDAGKVAKTWMSQRDPDDEDDDEGSGCATGNLDIVMPTGTQWDERGIALTLSQFIWNQSGLLSKMREQAEAILVSPAPTMTSGDKTYNASGLAIDPKQANVSHPTEAGLRVNAGDGLRIYGTDFGHYDATDTTDEQLRRGSLEIMYGPGFRIRYGNTQAGVATYNNKPVDANGALVPNEGCGLRVHGFTKMKQAWPDDSKDEITIDSHKTKLEIHAFNRDFAFQKDERLVLNDKAGDSHLLLADPTVALVLDTYAAYRGGAWKEIGTGASGSGAEYTVPQLVAYYNPSSSYFRTYYKVSNGKLLVNGDIIYETVVQELLDEVDVKDVVTDLAYAVAQIFKTFGVMYQHVGKAGIILGTDNNRDLSGITNRFATK